VIYLLRINYLNVVHSLTTLAKQLQGNEYFAG